MTTWDVMIEELQCKGRGAGETQLLDHLLGYLQTKHGPLVCVIQDLGDMKARHHDCNDDAVLLARKKEILQRIPIVCFVHANISSRDSAALSKVWSSMTCLLWNELGIVEDDNEDDNTVGGGGGVVRFPLAHNNTLNEIDEFIRILEMILIFGDGGQAEVCENE
ncbi:hypothetical protein ACHAXR_007893 [Thalassiosira sp. AJA248-18]